MLRLALGSLAMAGLWTAGEVSAAPLLNNGDFAAMGAEGWVIPSAPAGAAKVVDDDGHSGKSCLRLQLTAPGPLDPVTQRTTCRPNTEYVVSAWLKSADYLPSVKVLAEGLVLARLDLSDRGRWQPLSARFNSGRATELTVSIEAHAAEGPLPVGTAWVDDVQVVPAAEYQAQEAGLAAGGYAGPAPGPNIALGQPYTLSPAPNYSYCTEPGDAKQLTDGEYSIGYFWTQTTTVGWSGVSYADINIDLGAVKPIKGCSLNTAAGAAQVAWPTLIAVFASEDGQKWYRGGDVVTQSAKFGLPPEDRYMTYRFVTDELKLRGRYFRLLVAASPYTFVDEIEVYEGPTELMTADLGEPLPEDPPSYMLTQRVASAVRRRLLKDIAAFRQEATAEGVSTEDRAWAEQEAGRLTDLASRTEFQFPANWRAIHPLVPLHAEIYRARARVNPITGPRRLQAWVPCGWDLGDPAAGPPERPVREVDVHCLQGEYRSAAINLANPLDRDLTVTVDLGGLPGGEHPPWLQVHQVEWIETAAGLAVADALPPAVRTDTGWSVSVPSGMTRQVWLTFHPTDLKPGVLEGSIFLSAGNSSGGEPTIRLRLHVYPLSLPEQLSCSLGLWDYSCTLNYDLTDGNVDAAIVHMQQHFVDTPWNDAGGVPWPQSFDAEGNLIGELNWDRFDGWIADWAGAKNYAVFLAVSTSVGGVTMDDPRFPRAVGEWMHVWADHLREIGVDPSQLMLLLVDEPYSQEPADIITAWARAINAAEPDIVVWEDPTYAAPEGLTDISMFEASDVLCPNLGIFANGTDAHRAFYEKLRQQGKTLWFYQCSGPAKTHDPYTYHRLQHWYAFQYGAVGSGFWAYGDAAGVGTSWNELRAGRASFTPVYLDEESVVDGKHFEAVREGLEDYEVLRMLQDLAAKLAAEGQQARADRARALLTEAIDAVCGAGYDPSAIPWTVDKDRTAADRMRVRILEELTRE